MTRKCTRITRQKQTKPATLSRLGKKEVDKWTEVHEEMQQSIIRTTAQGTFYYIEQMCLCLIKRCSRAACLNLIMCVFQVTIWVERRTGQVVFTSTLRCPSDQARAASETFSEHISFSTQATSATSTMVGELKRWTHEIPAVLKRSQHQLTVISLRSLCQAGL